MNVNELAVMRYEKEILDLVKNNDVSIISAETASGKSVMIPQMLLSLGNYRVVVTEPRSIAAISLAEFVANLIGERAGNTVGYNTRFEKSFSPESKILYFTDGELLEAFNENLNENTIIVLDEVHEDNSNLECLMALYKKILKTGKKVKLVILSATMEMDAMSHYFMDAPVLEIQARRYPIECLWTPHTSMDREIIKLYRQGKNILAFYPGKKQIENSLRQLTKYFRKNDEFPIILPLHSELPYSEQKRAFASYSERKIILATNIAQTSITIPDIDVVVDSGLERVQTVSSDTGNKRLEIREISQAESIQRMGRAGRCKPGIYVLCSDLLFFDREKFPESNINNNIDYLVLKAKGLGYDLEELEFYHTPNQEIVEKAKNLLVKIGAMDNNELTTIGKQMLNYPFYPRFSRILAEAIEQNVLEDIIVLLAIYEVKGILEDSDAVPEDVKALGETKIFYELELFKLNYKNLLEAKKDDEFVHLVNVKNKAFFKAVQIVEDLYYRFNIHPDLDRKEYDIIKLKRCIISGLSHKIYYVDKNSKLVNKFEIRDIDKREYNILQGKLVVGNPIDIEVINEKGKRAWNNIVANCITFEPTTKELTNLNLEVKEVMEFIL